VDAERFDRLIKRAAGGRAPRRDTLKVLAGGALGLALGHAAVEASDAKRRKTKKKKCVKNLKICPSDPAKCCGKQCCADIGDSGQFCAPKQSVCCAAGGACASKHPTCCEDESGETSGCAPAGASCCPDGEHYCASPHTCCADNTCCSGSGCCEAQMAASARAMARQRQQPSIHGRR
jgi:hypothetical protein